MLGGTGLLGGGQASGGLLGGGGGTGLLGGGQASGGLLGGAQTTGGLLGGGGGGTGLLGGGQTTGGLLGGGQTTGGLLGGGQTTGGLLGGGGGTGLLGGGQTSGGLLGGGGGTGLLGGGQTSGGLLGGGTGLLGGGQTSGGLLGGQSSGGLLGGGGTGLLGGGQATGGLLGGGQRGGGLLGGQQAAGSGQLVAEEMMPVYGGWQLQPADCFLQQQAGGGLLQGTVTNEPEFATFTKLRAAYSNDPREGQLRAVVFDRARPNRRYVKHALLRPDEHDMLPLDHGREDALEPTVVLGFHGLLQRTKIMDKANKSFVEAAAAVLDAATQTVAKLKSHAGKVEELKRRHAKLSRRLLGVMQLVDCALAPTTVPSCAPGQARLTQQLEGLLTQLAQPGKGLVARAQQLILLQQELAGHTGAGRAGAMSASDEARLARHLPEITAHLERQQVTIRGLADLIKADQIDLEIMKRELRRKRGRRANHSAVDSVVSGLD